MDKDYTTYDALELAGDAWFIKWMLEGDPEAERFWLAWEKAHPDKEELLNEAKKLARAIRFKEEQIHPDKIKSIWSNIDTLTKEDTQTRHNKRRPLIRWMGYAAAAASVALVIIFWTNNPETKIVAQKAEQTQYFLPDSSLVRLNAATTASFNAKKWEEERVIQLEGEAFFEVKKGSTFKVKTTRGTVEVLGTSFNVNTHDGRFEVACYTGRVKVALDQSGAPEEVLTPGKKISLDRANQQLQSDTFNLDKKNWVEGNIEFQTARLADVFAEMERQFDVEIKPQDEAIFNEVYTGFLILQNLDSTLQAVCWPKKLKWELKENQSIIIIDYQ